MNNVIHFPHLARAAMWNAVVSAALGVTTALLYAAFDWKVLIGVGIFIVALSILTHMVLIIQLLMMIVTSNEHKWAYCLSTYTLLLNIPLCALCLQLL
ncbi:MAG: hypothetical protein WBA16_11770 [Nonlabens sp.]